jgi:hypothetical protein
MSSCKKSVDPAVQPAPVNGTLNFHLHTYVDVNEVDGYNIIYTTSAGRKISVSLAEMFLSNIQLEKSDGTFYSIPDTIVWVNQQTETYTIANVPSGQYKSVRFNVGLNPTQNASGWTTSTNHSEMWFGSTAQPSGYIFLNFQGKIDTTAAGNSPDNQMASFSYKIGTNANYKQVIMPAQSITVIPNQTSYVHLIADYNKLFTGIQINDLANLSVATVNDNSSALAVKVRDNIPSMFSYE